MRIVTLLPSATEIVCALGLGDRLVGVSHECDYPAFVRTLPVCTSAKINPEGSSKEIDEAVKASLSGTTSIYDIDERLLADLDPTHIVTQDQCEVCAVALDDVKAVVERTPTCRAEILVLDPQSLDEVLSDVARVGAALGQAEEGSRVVSNLRTTVDEISSSVPKQKNQRVACIEWTDPLMAAGNWVPELVTLAGGVDLFGKPGEHAPWMTFEDLRAADPDVIVFMPCGFGLERSVCEAELLLKSPEWKSLRAVSENRVVATDGNSFFNRPGPRVVDSLRILAEIVHPDVFAPTHQGTGWSEVSYNVQE